MNHSSLKACVVSFLILVLLYYSAAWSVLGCFHHEDVRFSEPTLSDADLHISQFLLSPRHHANAHLDCTGANYHTETLASSSFLSKLRPSTFDVTPSANDSLTLQRVGRAAVESVRLRAVFDPGSVFQISTDSPLYLSISVLRL